MTHGISEVVAVTPPVTLTIGGSDTSGIAGVQGDLKVFGALKTYGTAVLTAVTSQNTRVVNDVFQLPANVVAGQLSTLLDDMPVAAVKTGILASAEIASVVAAKARIGMLPNLVVDPELESATGRRRGVVSAIERLLPYALVATPNREEASALVGWQVSTPADMAGAAGQLASNGPRYVVVTGGDMVADGEAVDAVWTDAGARFLRYPRVSTFNDAGTGGVFAAAIAARLAWGEPVLDSIVYAKRYVARALGTARDWKLGAGHGPLDHFGWVLT